MADGSPTSGGAGDEIQTIDTFADTNSGTSGIKVAAGAVRLVDVLGHDQANVQLGNELPVRDERMVDALHEQLEKLQELLCAIGTMLHGTLRTLSVSGRTTRQSSVTAVTSSTMIVPFARGRLGVTLYTDTTSTGNLYIGYGADPAGNGAGLNSTRIVPGAYYETPSWASELPINGIWDSATAGFVNITEVW